MNNFIKLTVFFWKESYNYMSPWKFRDVMYSPIAYIKFMRLMYLNN